MKDEEMQAFFLKNQAVILDRLNSIEQLLTTGSYILQPKKAIRKSKDAITTMVNKELNKYLL